MTSPSPSPDPVIPTVDLADLDVPEKRAAALAAIREGFGTYGLVYVASHGVSDISALYDRWTAYCARPFEEKQQKNSASIWYQRGWTPPNTERAVVAGGQPDFKECWFSAPERMPAEIKAQYPEICADNVWPDDDAFREANLTLGRELHRAGLRLLRGAALALDLPGDAFSASAEGGAHVFRLLRYLPLTPEQTAEKKILWGEEHTDFNLLTLLPGGRFHDPSNEPAPAPDKGSGLYLRTRPTAEQPEGAMVRGTAPPGCIVAQVGQMLEILTGGTFLATPHVITPPDTAGWSRLSAAHFVHVHPHTMLFPMPRFRDAASVAAYSPPVLAGTYAIKTLVDIGLAPASAIDKLGYRHYDRLARIHGANGPT